MKWVVAILCAISLMAVPAFAYDNSGLVRFTTNTFVGPGQVEDSWTGVPLRKDTLWRHEIYISNQRVAASAAHMCHAHYEARKVIVQVIGCGNGKEARIIIRNKGKLKRDVSVTLQRYRITR
jgi:hypothetical protein